MIGILNYFYQKRELSKIDDSVPIFNLDGFKGYARITSIYDGDTFKACVLKHDRVLKFKFRLLGYDSPEMKPKLGIPYRQEHINAAVEARELLKELVCFDNDITHKIWNPCLCKTKINGFVYIECDKNDKYGRTLVTVYKHKNDSQSVNQQMIDSGKVNVYDGREKQDFNRQFS